MRYQIEIFGPQQPAGSKRAFPFKKLDGTLGVRVSDDNPKLKSWQQEVRVATYSAMAGGPMFPRSQALSFTVMLWRARPKSHFNSKGELNKLGRETPCPINRPDVGKLVRGLEDALTNMVYPDDSQICREVLSKDWAEDGRDRTLMIIEERMD